MPATDEVTSGDANEKPDLTHGEGPSTGQGDSAAAKTEKESVSRLDEYEELFKDRYTEKDPDYMHRVDNPAVPILKPNFDPSRYNRGGGGRRGNFQGGGWRGNGRDRERGGNGYRSWSGARDRSTQDQQQQRFGGPPRERAHYSSSRPY